MAEGKGGLTTREAMEARWREDVAWAEREMLSGRGVPLMAVVHARSGGFQAVLGQGETQEAKDGFFLLIRLMALADQSPAVVLFGEAWAVVGDDVDMSVAPSQSSRRVETVTVILAGRLPDGEEVELVSFRKVNRGQDEAVTSLEPLELPSGTGQRMVGRLGELLPVEAPTPEARRRARAEAQRVMKRIRRGQPPVAPGREPTIH